MKQILLFMVLAGWMCLISIGCTKERDVLPLLLSENEAIALLTANLSSTPSDSIYIGISCQTAKLQGVQEVYYNQMLSEVSKINQSIIRAKNKGNMIINGFRKETPNLLQTKAIGGSSGFWGPDYPWEYQQTRIERGPYYIAMWGEQKQDIELDVNDEEYNIAWCNVAFGSFHQMPFGLTLTCNNSGQSCSIYGPNIMKFNGGIFAEDYLPWSFTVELESGEAEISFALYEREPPQ